MRLGVVGSRSWTDRALFWAHLCAWMKQCKIEEFDPFSHEEPPTVVGTIYDLHLVSGGATRGADALAEAFARQKGLSITIHHAKWMNPDGTFNRAAGFERNAKIVRDCDILVAFHDGKSRGTLNTIKEAVKHGVLVWIVTPDGTVTPGEGQEWISQKIPTT